MTQTSIRSDLRDEWEEMMKISRRSFFGAAGMTARGEREELSFPRQQPIFTRGKLSLKSSLLLEAAVSFNIGDYFFIQEDPAG